jgi:protein associated with RNAse G/E
MGDEVRIVYRKYDGALHWHMTMKWLGEDEHGVWTGAGPKNTWRKGNGPLLTIEHPQVVLFPRDRWWTASFNADPTRTEVYCDITTPVDWPNPNEVTMIDLDLDVCRRPDGQVVVLDEDEFAEHRVKYGYPPEVISEALRATAWLRTALGDGREPFATIYHTYLALLADSQPR